MLLSWLALSAGVATVLLTEPQNDDTELDVDTDDAGTAEADVAVAYDPVPEPSHEDAADDGTVTFEREGRLRNGVCVDADPYGGCIQEDGEGEASFPFELDGTVTAVEFTFNWTPRSQATRELSASYTDGQVTYWFQVYPNTTAVVEQEFLGDGHEISVAWGPPGPGTVRAYLDQPIELVTTFTLDK